ncbi:hypothetical protein ABW17_08175 [Mycobacterium nebraskense]|uniref:DUF1490 family protein n=1 Tax=Mycobacterium nebraskense TaxID=244292 RepID=UPI000641C0F5|nr:DUF1490 family protein [Mycobacterium nebraskense]KLO44702.1 hypothetical protein ABW17_08175 [Mycobacterium nebraskense]
MVWHGLLAKAAPTVVTGVVGVAAYEGLNTAWAKAPWREASVTAAAWGLRGTRRTEVAAELARLKVADVAAGAIERVGEEVPRPAVPESAQTTSAVADDADH